MKNCATLLVVFIALNFNSFSQDFINLSKRIPQGVLPYSTSNEFLDVELFESKADFAKNGLIPLSAEEATIFIDENLDILSDHYFGVHRLQLTPKIIGVVYYKQIKDSQDEEDMSSYNFLLTTYSISGEKLSTIDFIGYEWLEETVPVSDEELEEEENFEEMEEDVEELEVEQTDTLNTDEIVDSEIISNVIDEGYAFSTISIKNNEVWIERKSVSYYSKDVLSTSYFKLNVATGEFDETER